MGREKSFVERVMEFMENETDVDADINKPTIKVSLQYVYPLFILLHACVCIVGTIGNSAMLFTIWRRILYRNPTMLLLANVALMDLIKSLVVLPITLASMLLSFWTLGSFLCYLMPMVQALLGHNTMLTYLVIALDRYRRITHPMKSRIPTKLCMLATCCFTICAVLPYAIYIEYRDLGVQLGSHFTGVGLCYHNKNKGIEEYIRAVFVVLYCLPLAIIAFLYVRVSGDLKGQEQISIHYASSDRSMSTATCQSNTNQSNSGSQRRLAEQIAVGSVSEADEKGQTYMRTNSCSGGDDDVVEELDVRKERRTQRYLIVMVLIFALCWCPVYILTLVSHFTPETESNSHLFDLTYLTFTFFAFLSCCANPVLFASWHMSNQTKDRLRGYFRFSNRRKFESGNESRLQRDTDRQGESARTVDPMSRAGTAQAESGNYLEAARSSSLASDSTWSALNESKKVCASHRL